MFSRAATARVLFHFLRTERTIPFALGGIVRGNAHTFAVVPLVRAVLRVARHHDAERDLRNTDGEKIGISEHRIKIEDVIPNLRWPSTKHKKANNILHLRLMI